MCSDYLDVSTTFNRLVYVVKLLTHNGIYVLLDNQFNLDTTVLDDQSRWLSNWLTLLRAVAQDPISASMLMVDVLNVSPALKAVKPLWQAFHLNTGVPNGLQTAHIACMFVLKAFKPKQHGLAHHLLPPSCCYNCIPGGWQLAVAKRRQACASLSTSLGIRICLRGFGCSLQHPRSTLTCLYAAHSHLPLTNKYPSAQTAHQQQANKEAGWTLKKSLTELSCFTMKHQPIITAKAQ